MASNKSNDLSRSWICDLCKPRMWSGVICEDALLRWRPSMAGKVLWGVGWELGCGGGLRAVVTFLWISPWVLDFLPEEKK